MGLRHLGRCCAVILALAGICKAQSAELQRQINQALDLARPALIDHLAASSKRTPRAGELALLALAGIHDGIPLDDSALHGAIKKLSKAKPHQTYDIALRLIVMEACPTFPNRKKLAKEDAALLLAHRSKQGAFKYGKRPSNWDLSNTQYGALGLRAAKAMGIKIPKAVWRKLAQTVGDQQCEDGGFCYERRGSRPYASMTVAGVAVLAICRQALGDGHPHAKRVDDQLDRGWKWMKANPATIGSLKEDWCFYYHYGLERAAILCDVIKVGGVVDWYARGSEMFVGEQLSGGGWRSLKDGHPGHMLSGERGQSVPTAFAVLFLGRHFQKYSSPVTVRIMRLVNIGPTSSKSDIDECARGLIKRGKDAMPDVLLALRSDIEQRRDAASQALRAIAGQLFGFDSKLDRDKNRSALRKAELWHLRNR